MSEKFSGTAMIVGAGFSRPAGLPLTSELSSLFLTLSETFPTPLDVQQVISEELTRFWEDVFGFEGDDQHCPSFEDHFTAVDLAANAGHHLVHYSPAQLRALRRMSIHRVFDVLDASYTGSLVLERLLEAFASSERTVMISTNWDVVVENHLVYSSTPYNYVIPGNWSGMPADNDSFPLIKLHGSANWHYCDVCRSLDFGIRGTEAFLSRTFLVARDFTALGRDDMADTVEALGLGGKPCHECHHRPMSARVATFSHSKAFDFFLFHAAWDAALHQLREAPFWTFVGYSLPDADFAFRHLLKTAETASLGQGPKQVRVVVGPDPNGTIEERYRRFFGGRLVDFDDGGVEAWVEGLGL